MKKLLSSLLAVVITIIIAVPASASNIDSSFKFGFGTGGGPSLDQYSSRPKENDSSTYVYYMDGASAYKFSVYGTMVYGIIERKGNSYPDAYDMTKGYYNVPTVRVGQRGFIRQLVYEFGYPYAVLGAWGTGIYSTSNGRWSPDSVPESGVQTLN